MKRDVSGTRVPKFHIYDSVTGYSEFIYTQDFISAMNEVTKVAVKIYNGLAHKMSYEDPMDEEGIIIAFWNEDGHGPSYMVKRVS